VKYIMLAPVLKRDVIHTKERRSGRRLRFPFVILQSLPDAHFYCIIASYLITCRVLLVRYIAPLGQQYQHRRLVIQAESSLKIKPRIEMSKAAFIL